MMNLSGSESDGEVKLKVNRSFAKHYNKSRRSEELMKLKARYGDVKLKDDEDSESESEDEDAEELTPAVEQRWLKTLAALKSNDPKIYDKEAKFFDSDEEDEEPTNKTRKKKKKEKRITLKDMDRKVILEREGQYSDDSENEKSFSGPTGKSYYEEQDEIKKSIKQAQQEISSEDDDDDDLLKVKVKSETEKKKEEEEYRKFIKGQVADLDNSSAKDLAGLRDYWNRDDMTEADRFLKEYILEKKYLEEDDSDDHRLDSDEDMQVDLSDQEKEDEKAEQFELKYNFRFEEPDTEFIKSYPRTIDSSLRGDKKKRKDKRAKQKESKLKEKEKRKQELNRLKNLKQEEIKEKLSSILHKSGAAHMPFTTDDLDDDFDPEEHDRKMKEMFPEDENLDDEVAEKPVFDYDPEIDDDEDWDKYGNEEQDETAADEEQFEAAEDYADVEDPNFNMDADYDPNAATLEDRNFGLDGGRSKKSKRRKSRLRKALEKKKPVFNPSSKSFDEYLDEYYGLECEDMIGELKFRFPYRQVMANDFGLSVGEILVAKDKELNSWSSLKKAVQYRTDDEEYRDLAKFKSKTDDLKRKKRLLPSLFETETEQGDEEEEDRGDNEQQEVAIPGSSHLSEPTKNTETSAADEVFAESSVNESDVPTTSNSKSKKRRGKNNVAIADTTETVKAKKPKKSKPSKGISLTRMEAYGMHNEVQRIKKLRGKKKNK